MKENSNGTDTNVGDIENSIEKDEKILNNIKTYMQENIDKGYHKFIYNDLGYDEKCIDVINAIEHILSDYKRVLKENEQLRTEVNSLKKENEELNYKLHSKKIALEIYNRYIPKSKVEDIIEELKINLVNMQGEELLIYESKIDILRELLGESEE